MISDEKCKNDRDREIVRMLNENKSTMDIAKKLYVDRKTVNNAITKMRAEGIEIPSRYKQRGKYTRSPRITNVTEVVEEIIKPKKDNSKFVVIKGEGKELLLSILKDF